jgi:uncharacterized alkaline shock family protein YloU
MPSGEAHCTAEGLCTGDYRPVNKPEKDMQTVRGSQQNHGVPSGYERERAVSRKRRSMTERTNSQGQLSSLRSEHGTTTIQDAVVSRVAGIAAQEVEKVQMGGGTSTAVGGFLQGVAGSVTGSSTNGGSVSRGVSVEVGEEEAAIDLTMAIEYGQSIPQVTESARRNVINRVENLVGLRVTEVNITVSDVQLPEERPMLGEQERVEQQAREQEQ